MQADDRRLQARIGPGGLLLPSQHQQQLISGGVPGAGGMLAGFRDSPGRAGMLEQQQALAMQSVMQQQQGAMQAAVAMHQAGMMQVWHPNPNPTPNPNPNPNP